MTNYEYIKDKGKKGIVKLIMKLTELCDYDCENCILNDIDCGKECDIERWLDGEAKEIKE